MIRRNVYADDSEAGATLVGWYDRSKATYYRGGFQEAGCWQELHLTAQNRWVLLDLKQWQGEPKRVRFVPDKLAHEWLLRHDEAAAEWFEEPE